MTLLSIPALVMAVIALYVACYHFLIYFRRPESRIDLSFALTALCIGMYDIFCAALYNVSSPVEGVQIQRWQLISLAFVSISYMWFVFDYTSMKSKFAPWLFTTIFSAFALIGLFDKSGLAWTDTPLIKIFQFPYFGWDITYYEMEFGLAMLLEAFMLMVFYFYLYIVAVHFYWKKNAKRAIPLVIAIGIFMLGMSEDVFVALGYYNFIYTIEYSFMGMVLVMAYALSTEIVERSRIKQELLESEKKFRALADTSPLAIYMSEGVEQKALYINPTFTKLFGYSIDEVPNADHWWPLAYPDANYRKQVSEEWQTKVKHAIDTKTEIEPMEVVVTCKDGSKKNISWGFITSGRQNWACGLDLTDRKRVEEERINLESQLRHSHKMEAIGTLSGGIAHDFNNILAAILGYADMAKDEIPEYSLAKYQIDQVLKAGNRAKDLVKHILTFSRKENQARVPVEVSVVVNEAIQFLRATIPTTIEIIEDIDEHCGQILADPTQINQVIVNLCTNAAQAMEDNGGTLEINLYKQDISAKNIENGTDILPGLYVILSVKDTGPGIEPENIERIFDPYFTTKEVGEGSGIGLAVVQGIIKSHEGAITVDSKKGEGSTFKVYFPIFQGVAQSEANDNNLLPPRGEEKILVVDDEESMVDMTQRLLERLGYQVIGETDSSHALEIFRSQAGSFDLVITDQTMPKLTGEQFAREIIQIRPDIPIILRTGYSSKIDKEKAMAIGIKAFSMKPIDKLELSNLIRKVLNSS